MTGIPRIEPLSPSLWSEDDRRKLKPYQRNGRVANVFATLLRHDRLADAWLAFGGYTFSQTTISARDREILILRTAVLANCDYEWRQHVRIGKHVGLSEIDFASIRQGHASGNLASHERALLRAVDQLIQEASMSDDIWKELAGHYNEKQMMDIVFTVGSYLTLAMALNSFHVQLDADIQ